MGLKSKHSHRWPTSSGCDFMGYGRKYNTEADFEFTKELMPDGKTVIYVGRCLQTGKVVSQGATAQTVYEATRDYLINNRPWLGNGTIIDRGTGYTGYGVCINRYRDGYLYDESLFVEKQRIFEPRKVLHTFDNGIANWTKVEGEDGTDETTWFRAGKQSIKLTAVNNTQTTYRIALSSPIDLTKFGDLDRLHFRFRVYWNTRYDPGVTSGAVFPGLYTTSYDNRRRIWCGLNDRYRPEPGQSDGSWSEYDFGYNDMGGTGGFDPTNVTGIFVTVWAPTGATRTVSPDLFEIVGEATKRTQVLLFFDDTDAGISSYAKPAMDKHGYKAALGPVLGLYPTIATAARKLASQGWEMHDHSLNHNNYDCTKPYRCVEEAIFGLRSLKHHGLLGKIRVFLPPGGNTNMAITDALRPYFHYMRLGQPSSWDGTAHQLYFPPADPMSLISYGCDGISLSNVQAKITDAITDRRSICLIWHSIGTGEWTEANFITLMDWLANQDCDVTTLGELDTRLDAEKYKRYATGSATIANGTSTKTVNHKMNRIPSVIVVEGTDSETKSWWITSKTATQFTINLPAATTADRTVTWRAWE